MFQHTHDTFCSSRPRTFLKHKCSCGSSCIITWAGLVGQGWRTLGLAILSLIFVVDNCPLSVRTLFSVKKRMGCPLQVGEQLLPQAKELKHLRVLFTNAERVETLSFRKDRLMQCLQNNKEYRAMLLIYWSICVSTFTWPWALSNDPHGFHNRRRTNRFPGMRPHSCCTLY